MSTSHQQADPTKLNQALVSLSLTLCHVRKLIEDAHQLSCEMHLLEDEKTACRVVSRMAVLVGASVQQLQAVQIDMAALPKHWAGQPSESCVSSASASEDVQGHEIIAQQKLLVVLRLVSYAADAMRVLDRFQWHADRSNAFDRTLRTVCADWRNPGCIDDPADLIALALAQTTQAMSKAGTNAFVGL